MDAQRDTDERLIMEHVRSIFEAYIRKDRDALRRTHASDWIGFQGPSVKIERGIDDYMVNAEASLSHLDGERFEIVDSTLQVFGDIGVLYYVARYYYRDQAGMPQALNLRSIDIYRRQNGHWNQIGSHITPFGPAAVWDTGGR
jgi:ketosteroid isomerase-like protein